MSKKNELLEIYNATRVYYEGLLNAKENEHIIKYLMDRGLTAEIIESSGIGFADIQANGLYSFKYKSFNIYSFHVFSKQSNVF